jgi:ligand-binding sensor domain-containing protein
MRTYATILCLLLTVPAYAVDTLKVTTPDPMTEAWRWTVFDRSNGLIGRVRDIYEDRDGAIWFASDHGVTRFDGHGWTSYSPPDVSTVLSAVYQTRDGQMWFGTMREVAES